MLNDLSFKIYNYHSNNYTNVIFSYVKYNREIRETESDKHN